MDDIKIDQELVRSLLEDQDPDLAELEIREVDGGWDNMMWRLGDELAVRLPRLRVLPLCCDQNNAGCRLWHRSYRCRMALANRPRCSRRPGR